jgi:hypothetical protein
MTDHDDKLTRRYRSLAREQPGAALDAAILAASRRAAARPSASRRWAMPVSVAAVLVLALGVTLRMQQEQPGIETAVPEYSQPAAPVPVPETTPLPPPRPSPKAEGELPPPPPLSPKAEGELRQTLPKRDGRPPAGPSQKPKEKMLQDSRVRHDETFQPAPALDSSMKEEARAIRAEPKPFANAPTKSIAPSPSEPAAAAAPSPATTLPPAAAVPQTAGALASPRPAPKAEGELSGFAPRMKREAAADSARALHSAPSVASEPERDLERIARLRVEGRHAEADKALEEFRRKYPDFRIPAAMWERVRAR